MDKRKLYNLCITNNKKYKTEHMQININSMPKYLLSYIISKTGRQMMLNIKLVCKKWKDASNEKLYYDWLLNDYCNEIIIKYSIDKTKYIKIPFFIEKTNIRDIFNSKKPVTDVFGSINLYIGYYEGFLNKGLPNGQGVLYFHDSKNIYYGDFVNGDISGYGTYVSSNKQIYGKFFKNMISGHAKIIYSSGNTYSGNVHNNSIHGFGTLKYVCGDIYEGEFKNNMINGYGVYYKKSLKQIYRGYWKDNNKHGYGYLFSTDNTFEGEFKNGKANGYGIHNAKKYIYEGEYRDNLRYGQGKITDKITGSSYIGEFKNNVQNGKGTIYMSSKIKYTGDFIDGKICGYGTLYNDDNTYYVGTFKNSLKNGRVTHYDDCHNIISMYTYHNDNILN